MKTLLITLVCSLFGMSGVLAQNTKNMLSLKERQIVAISGSAAKGD